MIPHTVNHPCPICEGHRGLPQGHGSRCWGFTSDEEDYAHCTRPELSGGISQHGSSEGYPHKLHGLCKCGQTHGDAEPVPIGEASGARVVAEYEYTDENDDVLFCVIRKEPKAFLQRRPNGEWGRGDARLVPYKLSEVISGVESGYEIWIAEGEKDVLALRNAGVCATCNAGGAGKWLDSFAQFLVGAAVVIVADKDEPGMDHARQVFKSLSKVAKSVRVVQAKTGKDASDHLRAGHALTEFVPVYPLGALKDSDPVAWKRAVLLRSTGVRDEPIVKIDHGVALAQKPSPVWPTGLDGEPTSLRGFTGVTFMVGGPSAGKSWWAVGSAIDSARQGWQVLYVAAEMSPAQILRRALRYTEGRDLPDGFEILEAGYGSTVDRLVEMIADQIDHRKTLVVLDSISSFVDQAVNEIATEDVHQIGPLKRLTMWALNVRRETNGEVSFLVLSEKNAKGETKGRFGDHKADLVVSIAIDEETRLGRRIVITKAWEQECGDLGLFALNPMNARLKWLGK